MMPGEDTVMLHVAEDRDKAWAELGKYFFEEASCYASWQTDDISSAVHSHATTPAELRAEGIYQVLTPDEVVDRIQAQGDMAFVNLHPLVLSQELYRQAVTAATTAARLIDRVADAGRRSGRPQH